MLAACAGAAAQNVGEEPIHINEKFSYGYFCPIPKEFTKEGKGLMAFGNYEENHVSAYYTSFNVYNDNLEIVKTLQINPEAYKRYSIITEREGVYNEEWHEIQYIGPWNERTEYEDDEYAEVEGLNIINISAGDLITNESISRLFITQTLFNDDENYEYIMPIKESRITEYERDRDGDGEIDYKEKSYGYVHVGFTIKSSNGRTLQTIRLENGKTYGYIDLLAINDKKYLMVYNDTGNEHFCYPLNPNSTGINPLGAPVKVKVSPRMADRSESFTVELDGDSNAEREVVVVNSAGQTVWKQKVPAGQRTVTIGAARLGKGVNVVRVNGGEKAESCKVIVK